MRLNRGVRRHVQQDRIKVRFRGIAEKHFGVDAREAGASDLIAVNRAAAHLLGEHAHLRQRLSAQQRSERQPRQYFHSHL